MFKEGDKVRYVSPLGAESKWHGSIWRITSQFSYPNDNVYATLVSEVSGVTAEYSAFLHVSQFKPLKSGFARWFEEHGNV